MRLQLRPDDIPEGYPSAYERELRLRDGRRVAIRPIVPSDAPDLAAAIRSADPETLHRRFLGGAPRLTPDLLNRLTRVDYVCRFALVAAEAASGKGVAIARYERLDDGVAEVSVAVDPAWRRVGLATALVELLAQAALQRHIHSFSASYLAENRPVAALLSLADLTAPQAIDQGLAESEVELDSGSVAAAVHAMDTQGCAPLDARDDVPQEDDQDGSAEGEEGRDREHRRRI